MATQKRLVFGAVFSFLGVLLLLRTTGNLPSYSALWPALLIAVGLLLLYFALVRGASERYILIGMVCTLVGIYVLLSNTILSEKDLKKFWPVFMTIVGISFIPYGYKKQGNARVVLLVPAWAIIGLSLVFLFFSLGLSNTPFRTFIATWWPAIFIIVGIVLVLSYIKRKEV